MSEIFTPIQIKGVHFKNRIVMAPMVRFGFSCEHGVMGEKLLQEYLERADKEIGLVITQTLSVTADEEMMGGAAAHSDEHISYLKQIADECHKNGTRLFAQIGLPGYEYHQKDLKDVNKLTEQEIEKIRNEFIHSAELCRKAGLDGVELHGAHAFFLNMMSSSLSNKREDKYGGDISGRLTLVKEIVQGIKAFAEDDFIVSYRMGWTENLDTDILTGQELEKIGIDMIHVSKGIPEAGSVELPVDFEYNEVVYRGYNVKLHANIQVIVVNGIQTLERGNKLIENDKADFVAYGKPFLADASFVKNSIENMKHKPCFGCKTCQWFLDSEKCPAKIIKKR